MYVAPLKNDPNISSLATLLVAAVAEQLTPLSFVLVLKQEAFPTDGSTRSFEHQIVPLNYVHPRSDHAVTPK